ncbi:MAG: LemA family protein [Acidobacteria bacterium]|nr:LemA family protein [Acidobacteriota bacterium]
MSDLFEKDRTAEREQFRQEYSSQQQALAQAESRKRKTWTITALVLGGLILIFGIGSVSSYNGLVGQREEVRNKWSQVENQMQRRADLIPNLVSTVKGITKQELEVFSRVAEARSKLLSPTASPEERVRANEQISQFRVQMLSLAEQYPQLRSSENFNRLMDELAGTENRIAVARRDYIQAAQDYNVTTSRFPTVIVARLFGFQPQENYFKAAEGAREVPRVEF